MDYIYSCFSISFSCFCPQKRRYYTFRRNIRNEYARLNQLDDVEIENLLGSDLQPFEPKKHISSSAAKTNDTQLPEDDFSNFLSDETSEAKILTMSEVIKMSSKINTHS